MVALFLVARKPIRYCLPYQYVIQITDGAVYNPPFPCDSLVSNILTMKTPLFACLTAFLLLAGFASRAQSFDELTNRNGDNPFTDRGLQFFVRYTGVNCKYTESYGGFTGNMSYRIDRLEKGEMSYHFENPTLGDLLWMLVNLKKWNALENPQAYGSGFFGWHEVYWNVVSKDRILLSPGLSVGDYIYSSGGSRNPSGYFFHIGPAFKTSYVINNDFWVDGIFRYDVGFRVGKPTGNEDVSGEGYPKPHFVTVSGTLNHAPSRLFTNIRINTLIDRGVYKDAGVRLDWSVGMMF